MKKNKLISFALILALSLTTAANSVYAGSKSKVYLDGSTTSTDSTVSKVGNGTFPTLAEGEAMTVDAAVARAIERSTTIKSYEDNIEIAEDNLDDIRVYRRAATEFTEVNSYAISYKSLEASIATYKDRIEAEKQSIQYKVVSYFVNIINAQNSLAIYDEYLDIETRNLEIYEKQLELGLISQTQYESYVDAYNTAVTNKTTLQNTIDSNYTSLNTLLDYNVAAVYDIELGEEVEYEPIDRTTLAAHVTLATSAGGNVNIAVLERNVEIAQYTLDLHSDLYSSETRMEVEADLYSATSSLNDTKLSYEGTVKTLYQSIIESEENYSDLVSQLNTLNNTMSVYEKQYELGQITELQLDTYHYTVKSLENQIDAAVYSHYLAVLQYDNPNLLG
ncbi:MAG: TolC family protein [Clostridiales bacterium]|nr:TolC family protein [Clostridiales bacterium]